MDKKELLKKIFEAIEDVEKFKKCPELLQLHLISLDLRINNLFEIITDNPRKDLTEEDLINLE